MHPTYTEIPDSLRDWALRQPVFFVATAQLRGRHINISPKGLTESSLVILSPGQVAYVDSVGSGCETLCKVRENGQVMLLLCSFDKMPRILRVYCIGSVVEFDEPEYGSWLDRMGGKNMVAARAVIVFLSKVCALRTAANSRLVNLHVSSGRPKSRADLVSLYLH